MDALRQQLVPIGAIAFNTFREAARSKVLYSILLFCVLLIGFSAILGELSLQQHVRVIQDLGLFALSLFGSLTAIFLGVSFVYKEIERKSIYNIVSKPIQRWQYYLGKYLGMLMTVYLQLAIMGSALVVTLLLFGGGVSLNLFVAIALILAEVTVMAAVGLLFSAFSTPYLSGFMALGVFLVGKSADLLSRFAAALELPPLALLLDVVDRVVPALYIFNITEYVTYDLVVPQGFVFHAMAYGLCYAAVVLMLGAVIFSRRDFA